MNYAVQFFDSLGLIFHVKKSMLVLTHNVEYRGVILDLVNMAVTLLDEKNNEFRCFYRSLLTKKT